MKKRNKIIIVSIIVFIISLFAGYVYISREFNLFSRSMASSALKSKGNNEFTINIGIGDLIHDYVNIMLKLDEGENINEPLEFDVVDGKGNIVETGKLETGIVFRKSYKLNLGEWKIRFKFNSDNQKAYINFGYNINSTQENTTRVD